MTRWHPTFEDASSILEYHPQSGKIFWAVDWGKMKAGQIAGTHDSKGYLRIGIFRRRFRAHRLAWLLHYGEWPKGHIDHRNGVRDDNRISNLRVASVAQNNQNRKVSKANASGLLGAHQSWGGKFKSEIAVGGRRFQLGIYDTAELAHRAYLDAKRVLHSFNPEARKAISVEEFAGAMSRELGIRFVKNSRGISIPSFKFARPAGAVSDEGAAA